MKRKLLITTSNFPLSENDGQSQFMLEYAKALQHEFEVFVLAPKNHWGKRFETWDGITIYRFKQSPIFNFQLTYGSGILGNMQKNPLLIFLIPGFILMQAFAIRRLVKKENIEIINAHWIFPQGLCMALLKLSGLNIPYILNVHSGKFWMIHTFPLKPLISFSLKAPNAITCVSKALVYAIKEIRTENVFHLPLGVDLENFNKSIINKEIRNKYNLENKKVIIFIGTMINAKGVNQLIKAMPNVISDFPETILLMIGEGHLLNHLKKYTENHGMNANVIFTGKIDHHRIPEYLSVADLLCLPSYMEGFPVVVKEALAVEVLVLATELPVFKFEPELKNIIFFIEKVNEIALEKKIKEILFNGDTFDDRKRKGRNFVEKNASWHTLSTQFKSISEQ